MDPTSCPDAWDRPTDPAADNHSDGMDALAASAAALNVKATPFIPGKNIWAREFVPLVGEEGKTVAAQSSHAAVASDVVSGAVNNSTEHSSSAIPDVLMVDANSLPTASAQQPKSETGRTVQSHSDALRSHDDSGISPDDILPHTAAVNPVRVVEDMESTDGLDNWSDRLSESGSAFDESVGGADRDTDSATSGHRPKKQVKPASVSTAKRSDHLNIVFIGHVDAGKSTIGGQILFLTGRIDKRTLEKYEREAKDKNRESWYLSWALDTNLEERDKGKTVEVGRAYFETEKKHFTILDAPGHKSFVPNMISGASQADVAVLVISARKGEFETGFERGGQTREHAMLVKSVGVKHLIILVNKMDDPTVEWDETRFAEIRDKLTPYLRKVGFNPKTDFYFIPVSGFKGVNLKDCQRELCTWYEGPSFIEYLDNLPPVTRKNDGPVRLPIVDRYKDMGTIVLGKLESGVISKGLMLMMMPNKCLVEVMQIFSDEEETDLVNPGENVKIKLKNVEEEDISPGFILCSPDNLCHSAKIFDAQVVVLEHKSIICAGYKAVMHLHTSAEEVVIMALLCLIDTKTGEKSTTRPRFVKQHQTAIVRMEVTGGIICLETFKDFPQMGRFTLRDEGKTIGIGKVLKVVA